MHRIEEIVNLVRECTLDTFISRHGDTPDEESEKGNG